MKNELQIYLKENARHGTQDFPVGFYNTQVPRHFRNMLVHWHEEMELGKVRSGKLIYDIDQVQYTLKEGDILLISPDTLHSAHQLQKEPASTNSVVFHLRLAGLGQEDEITRRYVQPIREGKLRVPAVVREGDPGYEKLNACFEAMWECRNQEMRYRELQVKSQVYLLIQYLWELAAENGVELPRRTLRVYEDKLKLALAYIQDHYAEPVTIEQLAKICGFSQVHFMNIFKAAIGSTCITYLVEYRLARAALDLQETDHAVTQVAMDAGFQNISYFNRAFKNQYGMTPSEYRRKMR